MLKFYHSGIIINKEDSVMRNYNIKKKNEKFKMMIKYIMQYFFNYLFISIF